MRTKQEQADLKDPKIRRKGVADHWSVQTAPPPHTHTLAPVPCLSQTKPVSNSDKSHHVFLYSRSKLFHLHTSKAVISLPLFQEQKKNF